MIRFAAAALLASLLAGTAMAQTVGGTTNAVSGASKPAGAMVSGHYADAPAAKAHCPADTVVWANTSSKTYHLAGTKYYGKTKKGAYMCQKEADAGGYHVQKHKAADTAKEMPAKPAAKSN